MAQTSPDLASSGTLHEIEPIERETIRRVTWRLMPLLNARLFLRLSGPVERRHGRDDHGSVSRVQATIAGWSA